MAMDPSIVDQGYRYFLMEAPELLQALEQDLLTLAADPSVPKVHSLMRTAHTLKGSAASVGRETIQTVAHYLEDVFKALYNPEVVIDAELEGLIWQGFDCLKIPLLAELQGQAVNETAILDKAATLFGQLRERLGDFMSEDYLPSSAELGFDLTESIFDVGVGQRIDELESLLKQSPDPTEVHRVLSADGEVFVGLAESLGLPGFGQLAQTMLEALAAHPQQTLQIAQLVLQDLQQARLAVLQGDRTQGGSASLALQQLAGRFPMPVSSMPISPPPTQPDSSPTQPVSSPSSPAYGSSLEAIPSWAGAPPLDSTPKAPPATEPILNLDALSHEIDALTATVQAWSLKSSILDIAADPLPADPHPDLEAIFGRSPQRSDPEKVPPSSPQPPPVEKPTFPTQTFPTQTFPTPTVPTPDRVPPLDSWEVNTPTLSTPQLPTPTPLSPDPLTASLAHIWGSARSSTPIEATPPGSTPSWPTLLPTSSPSSSSPSSSAPPALPSTPPLRQANASPGEPSTAPPPQRPFVRVDVELLERLNNLVGELLINQNRQTLQNEHMQTAVHELMERLQHHEQSMQELQEFSDQGWLDTAATPMAMRMGSLSTSSLTGRESEGDYGHSFDPLELDRYSRSQLQIQQALEDLIRLREAADDIDAAARTAHQLLESQQRMLTGVRDDVMQARMLPLGELFNRFPRMLRDLSAKYQKPVDLKLIGSEVLVDKAVLEKLYEPLLHLVRNAFDHGIEPPQIRRQQGKPERGQITLKAFSQGGRTLIEVSDDGQGLNPDRIRQRAVDMAILSRSDAASLPLAQLYGILFEPGFSTATQVNELSGRGVGLDVVRGQVQALKGVVAIRSQLQQGTTFSLQFPQTLTIARLLVCQSGSEVFAFLTDGIEQILLPKGDQVVQRRGQPLLRWGAALLPVRTMADILEYYYPLARLKTASTLSDPGRPESRPLLLINTPRHQTALAVDQLLGEQELVIKPLGNVIAAPPYVYGCSILGDGRLVLVVDGAALLEQVNSPPPISSPPISSPPISSPPIHRSFSLPNASAQTLPLPPPAPAEPQWGVPQVLVPQVLVVDDSLTLRQTLAAVLERAGYQVVLASHGQEALEQLQAHPKVQIILCDIEMPHMNGFEFLAHYRKTPMLPQVPVVMLTSRRSEKHHLMALELGANHYLTKPYREPELLATLESLRQQP